MERDIRLKDSTARHLFVEKCPVVSINLLRKLIHGGQVLVALRRWEYLPSKLASDATEARFQCNFAPSATLSPFWSHAPLETINPFAGF